jgi:hypothetical protein
MALPALALRKSTLDEYTAHLQNLRALVQSCQASATACDPDKVGADEQILLTPAAGQPEARPEARFDWLRSTLKQAHDPKYKNRNRDLASAAARIEDDLREAGISSNTSPVSFAKARPLADSILGHPEFVTVTEQSIWQRLIARFFLWLDGLFGDVARFGARSPWIGPLLEWGFAVLTLSGLSVWAIRAFRRQRLAVQIESARQIEPWEEASRNWRTLAEEQAARSEWREAVHCLYWASIVMLEGRRSWSPNRSRTPREYLRLIEAGSPRWRLLREQTLGFERIWYGLNPAQPQDYQSALHLHEELRTA